MRVCIAGKNEIAVRGLEYALTHLHTDQVLACPNENDDGISRWQPSLRRFAREWGVQLVSLTDLYERDDLVFISLEFDRIVRPNLFRSPRLFNIHFSKLPAYKGMYTVAWPILNGEALSGVTLHKIDEGIDTGDVIDQVDVRILPHYTARDLYFDCIEAAISILQRNFASILANRFTGTPQAAEGSSYYSKSSINYRQLSLDLRNTAAFVTRQARAFHFREFQIPEIQGLPVCNGRILDTRSRAGAGRLRREGNDGIIVSTVDFDVRFERDSSWDYFQLVAAADVAGIVNCQADRALIDVSNSQGMTPLLVACREGMTSVVEALIRAGADPLRSNTEGSTPLMFAKDYGVRSGDYSVCRVLLDAGSDPLVPDRFGRTVLDYARLNDERSALHFLGATNDA